MDRHQWRQPLVQTYHDHFTDLARIAYLMVGRRDVAEEITQDAFVAANRTWDGQRDPFPYVRAAVINRCRSWHRRRDVERRHAPPPPDPVLIQPDEMWDVLQTLPDRERTAVVLRFYEQLSYRDIGEILDCPEPTVRTIVHRSLKQMRKELS